MTLSAIVFSELIKQEIPHCLPDVPFLVPVLPESESPSRAPCTVIQTCIREFRIVIVILGSYKSMFGRFLGNTLWDIGQPRGRRRGSAFLG